MHDHATRYRVRELFKTYCLDAPLYATELVELERMLVQRTSPAEYRQVSLQICHDLTMGHTPAMVMQHIGTAGTAGLPWLHPTFDSARKLRAEQDEYLTKPDEVVDAVFTCRCGSSRTITVARQERAADEGTTVRVQCVNCFRKWIA